MSMSISDFIAALIARRQDYAKLQTFDAYPNQPPIPKVNITPQEQAEIDTLSWQATEAQQAWHAENTK